MINKKMIPVIIIFVILIIIIIVIICNCNKKNKDNLDKLQQCKQQTNQSNQQLQQYKKQLEQHKKQLEQQLPKLKDNQLTITNLQKKIKANKFKLKKASYFSKKSGKTYEKTMSLLHSLNVLKPTLGARKKPRLGVTNEDLEEMISEMKGDMGANEAAEKYGEIGDATVELLSSIYEGFEDGFSEQSTRNLIKTVGITSLDIFFACMGMGFMIGPFNGLISIFNKSRNAGQSSPDLGQIVQVLTDIVSDTTIKSNLKTIQNNLNSISGYLNSSGTGTGAYSINKYYDGIMCTFPNQYCPTTDPNDNTSPCDFDKEKINIKNCMTTGQLGNNINPRNHSYDPSALDTASRTNLNTTLNDCGSVFSMINSACTTSVQGFSTLDSLTGLNYMINGYNLYVTLITNTMAWYQELVLYNTSYSNPYSSGLISIFKNSLNLGNPPTSSNSFPYSLSNIPIPPAVYPPAKNGFFSYIQSLFGGYIRTLLMTQTVIDGNPFLQFNDNSGLFTTPNDNGQTWYQLISEKYNDNAFPQYEEQIGPYDQLNFGDTVITSIVTKYLTYFNEFMDFPFDTYILYMKITGQTIMNISVNPPIPATGNDLFNLTLYSLYTISNAIHGNSNNCWQTGYQTVCTGSYGLIFNAYLDTSGIPLIKLNINNDPIYLFGLTRPSNVDAMNLSPSLATDLATVDLYNTYCTPIYPISPGNTFDGTIFNLPGDPSGSTYTTNMYCPNDPEANGVKSCLAAGVNPGSSSNPGTRVAYCINTATGLTSSMQNYGTTPAPGTMPTSVALPFYKCWNLNPQILSVISGNTSGNISGNIWTLYASTAGIAGPIYPTWNSSTNTLENINDGYQSGTITFDNNQNIIAGTGTFTGSKAEYYFARIPSPPASGYKCWNLRDTQTTPGPGSYSEILRLDSSNNWTLDGNTLYNVTPNQYILLFNRNSSETSPDFVAFGPNESVILRNLDGGVDEVNISYYIEGNQTLPPTGYNQYWAITTNDPQTCPALPGMPQQDCNYLLVKNSSGVYTLNGNIITGGPINSTLTFSGFVLFPPFNTSVSGSIIFGKDESIIGGTINNANILDVPIDYSEHS